MKSNKKIISVITPVYNGEKYIERCIQSILNQTYDKVEHIVVDDGSTDKTLKICSKYKDKIKLISKKNEGVSKARNDALKKVSGEYIFFADADDWLEENALEKMMKKMEKDNLDVVVCEFNNFYENKNEFERVNIVDKYKTLIENILDEDTNVGGYPWNKLINKRLITNIYNTDVHYYENLLFLTENLNKKLNYGVIHEPLYNYCINDCSALHSKKYSIKKLTQLTALKEIIDIIPQKFIEHYKYLFIVNYYENLYYIKKERFDKKDILVYKEKVNSFYNDIKFSKKINIKQKIKLFIIHRINFIYKIFKNYKDEK